MKVRNALIAGAVIMLLIATAFVLPGTQKLQAAPAAGTTSVMASPLINTQTASAAVMSYWTPERMAAAKGMEVAVTKTASSQAAPAPEALAPTGVMMGVGGNLPGQTPLSVAAPMSLQTPSPVSAVVAWYAYPFPYTKSYIAGSWPSWYPFITNGKLFFTQYGVNYVCSGTSTTSGSGGNRRLVWTAGHCTHAGDGSANGWSYNVLFCPGYANGAATVGCWAGIQDLSFTAWASGGNLKYDQGVIVTGDNSTTTAGRLGDVVGTQGLTWNQSYVQEFWQFGYPQAAPYDGKWQLLNSSSTAEADDPNGLAGPYTMGVGSDLTGGASGGGWIIGARIGNWGYLNGLNSYKYISPARPLAMYGPYFDSSTYDLFNAARVVAP
jgi:hypothetical protein